jgi:hypothetical protein
MNDKICISIPVHENAEVIIDQISNFKYFYNDNIYIILHIARENNISKDEMYKISKIENVFINNQSLHVQWGTLIHVHNSNFRFADSTLNLNFKYFVLHASNDLYVRFGAEEYIRKSKNGVMQLPRTLDVEYLYGNPEYKIWKKDNYIDEDFVNIMNYFGIKNVMGTQPEGIFFERHIFREMVRIIDLFYKYGNGRIYPREEYWYSTIIQKFVSKIKPPLLFSEVYGKIVKKGDKKEEIVDKWKYVGELSITDEIIKNLHNGENIENLIVHEQFYDCLNLYAVKRINRDINDHKRKLIRNLIKEDN